MTARAVQRAWFERPAPEVAADLLGAVLTTLRGGVRVSARLTEVEAYAGESDPVSHAHRGRTARNASMFLSGGHLYVYRHLGLHHCVNVVTGPPGEAGAVLLRAGEVVEGVEAAVARRTAGGVVRTPRELARGPARLVVALGLGPEDDGADLLAVRVPGGSRHAAGADRGRVEVAPDRGLPDRTVLELPGSRSALWCGPRVGVGAAGRDPGRFAWRFWVPDDPTVSPDRGPARPRRATR